MYEILPKIIDSMESHQLEEIFAINKLNLQGFRIKGPSSKAKTQRMKTLLSNNSKLDAILKNTAEEHRIRRNKDYTWAFASTVDSKVVQNKINETNIADVTFALIEANKLYLIKDYFEPDKEQTTNKVVQDMENKSEYENLDLTIRELRKITTNLEKENINLKQSLKTKREELAKLSFEYDKLKLTNNDNKSDLKNINDKYLEQTKKLELTNEELMRVKEENTYLIMEMKSLQLKLENSKKLNILVYGTNIYKKFIDNKAKELTEGKLSYDYVNTLNYIEKQNLYHKLIILTFTLTTLENQELLENEIYKYFSALYNVVFITSVEQLEDYMIKVGRYNE